MITGSGTTWCQVRDMARSAEFYRDVLGLTCLFESTHWTEFETGSGKIALHLALTDGVGPLGEVGKGWLLGLETPDVVGLQQRIRESGLGATHDFHEVPSGVTLTVTDLDGNPLQVIQHGVKMADLGLSG